MNVGSGGIESVNPFLRVSFNTILNGRRVSLAKSAIRSARSSSSVNVVSPDLCGEGSFSVFEREV